MKVSLCILLKPFGVVRTAQQLNLIFENLIIKFLSHFNGLANFMTCTKAVHVIFFIKPKVLKPSYFGEFDPGSE